MIIAGHDREIAEWVAKRCRFFAVEETPFVALGWHDPRHGLIAGVVFDNYHEHLNIDMHVAAELGTPWMHPFFLGECFRYPFLGLKCERVTGRTPAENLTSRRFSEALGFRVEGRIRRACPGGEDLIIYGMLKSECRWLDVGRVSGKTQHAVCA